MVVGLVLYFYFSYQQDIAKTAKDIQEQSQTDQPNQYNPLPEDNGASSSTGEVGSLDVTATPSASKTSVVSNSSPTIAKPTASATASKSPTATATPGDLDWTRQTVNKSDQELIDYTKSNYSKIADKDICELIEVSDSWSQPVEKITCGIIKVLDEHILAPLVQLTCVLEATSLKANYADNIDIKYVDNQCKIVDR